MTDKELISDILTRAKVKTFFEDKTTIALDNDISFNFRDNGDLWWIDNDRYCDYDR